MSWSRTPYRNPREYSFTNLEQPAYAFLPCAPGCRGSESDPRYCHCICRGINHGILIHGRSAQPVPVPYGYNPNIPLAQLPELAPRLETREPEIQALPWKPDKWKARPERPVTIASNIPRSPSVSRKIGRSFLRAMTGHHNTEEEKNTEIMQGLRKQFSQDRIDAIITESFAEYFSHDPDQNTPELYELLENGTIDNVLARRNVRWVLGRPRKK